MNKRKIQWMTEEEDANDLLDKLEAIGVKLLGVIGERDDRIWFMRKDEARPLALSM